MCTRCVQPSIEKMGEILAAFDIDEDYDEPTNYDVRPTTLVPAIRLGSAGRYQLTWLPWMYHHERGSHPNAKGENLKRIPTFKESFDRRRCLVPAMGYYEWSPVTPKFKQCYFFTRKDGRPILFPGIYSADEKEMAIITMPPSSDIAGIHDRMPIFLEEPDWERYLAPEPLLDEERKRLIATPPAGLLNFYPVDNKAKGKALTVPLVVTPTEKQQDLF